MEFVVIGLGSFGSHIAKTLYEEGNAVLAVDKSKEKVEEMKNSVSHVVKMDAAVKENMQALDLQGTDVVIVSLGPDLETSILTVLYLHELGVKRILAKLIIMGEEKRLEKINSL